jgi:hypothetical protein
MIQDEAASLDAVEQYTGATWAIKTILAVGPTNLGGMTFVPSDMYRWFGDHQMPLPGSIVWLGRYAGGDQWPLSFHLHGMVVAPEGASMPPPGSDTNGFDAVLAVGNLALCVFHADVPEGPVAVGDSGDKRVKIWPNKGGAVWWPPSASFEGTADLEKESRLTPGGPADPLPGPPEAKSRT